MRSRLPALLGICPAILGANPPRLPASPLARGTAGEQKPSTRLRPGYLPLQEKTEGGCDSARPKQPGVIGRRAEKCSDVGNHLARAGELIKALDRRLSGQ